MSLDDIEVFVEVVDRGSFTKGAKLLGIPLSTASSKVARLEETLGVTLLKRTTRQVHVTEEGKLFYAYCVQALSALTEGKDLLGSARAAPKGTLRVSAPVDLSQFLLVDAVDAYLTRWPEVSIDLIVTNRKVDLIAENIDVALRIGPLDDSSLIARKFIDANMCFYASRAYIERHGHPESDRDLSRHNFIRMSLDRNMTQRLETVLPTALWTSGPRIAADDISTIRAMVAQGLGIGLLPSFAVEKQPDQRNFLRVLPTLSPIPIAAYFIYPPQRFLAPKLRAFLNIAA